MQNPKAKGNLYEKEWAEFIKDIDPTATRNYGSGSGVAKSDVHNSLGYEFECKRVEKLNIFKAIQEAERHSSQAHSIPAVVFRRNHMDTSYVAIPDWHFKELVRKAREPKTMEKLGLREQKWAINNLITSAKKVLKYLDQEG